MRKQFKKICLFIITVFIIINSSFAQIDTLFWFAVPYATNLHDAPRNAYITLTAMDTDDITNVMITQPHNPALDTIYVTIDPLVSLTEEVFLNQTEIVKIMNNNYVQNPVDPSPFISNSAIKIQADRDITAYYEYHRERNNPDIFSLKGSNSLGYDFWIPYQDRWDNNNFNNDPAFSQIIVTATKPNTEITITFPKRSYDILPGPYTFTLDEPGMTLLFVPRKLTTDNDEPSRLAGDRLNGVHITSNEPIAVTVGDDSARKGGAYDMIGDQLVPVKNLDGKWTIGEEYIVMKGEVNNSNGNEKVYVLTTEPNTTLSYQIRGQAMVNLPLVGAAGSQRVIDLLDGAGEDYVYIVADKPVYVWHVSGFGDELGGAIVPTIDGCTGSLDVSFVRSKNQAFYLNIMTHGDALNDFEISLDGGLSYTTFLDNSHFEPVGIADFYVLKDASSLQNGLPVGDPIRIRNLKNVFHLGTINGVTSGGGCAYGYFSDFKENRGGAVVVQSGTDIITTCYGDEVQLKANGGLSYFWTSPSGSEIYLDDPTIADPSAFLPVGIHTYEVTIGRPCFPDTTLQVSIEIYENSEAYFTLDENIGCAPFSVEINNLSLKADTFLFDFENDRNYDYFADTNMSPTFTHTYYNNTNKDSIYTLRLLAYDKKKDCPDIIEKKIRVFPEIHAHFTPDTLIGCNPLPVAFTDSSYGNLDKYKWIFGDGESSNTVGDETHEFQHSDPNDTTDFIVELITTSPYFCKDTARRTISVFPYLDGEFTKDIQAGCSPLEVTFTNSSTGEDSVSLFYGDGNRLDAATFASEMHTYINTSDTVTHFPVELQAFNNEGCVKIWRDTITVYPEVQAAFALDTGRVCNTDTIQFTRTSPHGEHIASNFYWTFGDGSNTNTDSTVTTFNKVYTNTTNSDQTYPVRLVTQSQYGCTDTVYRDVLVYRAQADFVLDENDGCSPLEVNITNQSKGTGIDYLWEFDDGVTPNSTAPQPANPTTYSNVTDAVSQHYLSLTVSSSDGLCSTNQTDTITAYPEIHITNIAPSDSEVCDSTNITLMANIAHPSLPNVSYTWDFDDGTSSNSNPTTHLFRNINYTTFVDRNVRLDVETEYGCTDFNTEMIRVHPRVRAFFTMDASSGCSPDTITVTPTYYPGISEYAWDFDGDGTIDITSPSADPQTHVFPRNTSTTNANDIYDVTLTVSNGNAACTKTFSRTDTVFAEALADFGPIDTIGCNPFKFTFRDYSINANQYTWDFKDGTTSSVPEPTHQFINTTPAIKLYDVNLEVTSTNGCTNDTTGNIEVYPYTNADFDIDLSEGCSPLTVNISNNSSGTEFYWFWDDDNLNLGSADSTITSSFSKTYHNTSGTSRTDSLTLIVGNGHGCYDTLKRGITIHSSIIADFSYVQNNACNPSDVVFTNTSTGGGTYTMNWNFGDGSSLTTTSSPVNKTFTNNTTNDKTFTVVMTAESEKGCTDSHTDNVTVYSKVIADYSIEENQGCPSFTTTIQNTSIGNASNTYQWLVDGVPEGPTNKDDFTHTYENSDTSLRPYQVRLVAENEHGCTSEYIDTVTVFEYVEASYSMNYDAGCNPLAIQFTDLSVVPSSTKYTWDFGDGATTGIENPSHTFYNSSRTSERTYTVDLTVQSPNYCTDDTSAVVTVYHQPLAKFFIDNTSSCPPLESYMEKESVGDDLFEWRFGDGTTNTTDVTTTHIYPNTLIDTVQNYTLELWVGTTEGCKDSTSLELSVYPDVIADFTYDESGCSPFVSSFINESTSPARYFYWNFDDGNTSNQENPVHRFVNTWNVDRTYNVLLKASSEYNCWDTITKQVTAYAQPIVSFDASPVVQKFPENRVILDNFTNDGPFDYLWEFGDLDVTTSTDVEPNYFDYGHWGEKDITLTVTSQTSTCNDTLTRTVTILPPDVNADFTTNIDGGCLDEGLDVDFIAAGSMYSEVYEYTWDFGDGETGQGAEITHTYTEPGVYNVKLTATGEGGEDYEYKKISVYSNPVAYFELLPPVSMLDAETLTARVEFYNQSECNDTSGCSYLWDFGDGKTSIATNVTHYYEKPPDDEIPKEYDVKLVVTNSQGCVDSLIKERAVKVIGEGDIAFPNAFTPNEDGINDIFKPVYKGVVEYELLIYNRWGELIFRTNDLDMGWNGKVGGKEAKSDVYVWKAEGTFTNGRPFELAGDVTLIR
ncbi:MAG TPA: PKD domain-containing protein [Bacteroidales bacterium]|nr:PKD domain-containing protein [Bacteroidales bacterium]